MNIYKWDYIKIHKRKQAYIPRFTYCSQWYIQLTGPCYLHVYAKPFLYNVIAIVFDIVNMVASKNYRRDSMQRVKWVLIVNTRLCCLGVCYLVPSFFVKLLLL